MNSLNQGGYVTLVTLVKKVVKVWNQTLKRQVRHVGKGQGRQSYKY